MPPLLYASGVQPAVPSRVEFGQVGYYPIQPNIAGPVCKTRLDII